MVVAGFKKVTRWNNIVNTQEQTKLANKEWEKTFITQFNPEYRQ